MSNIRPLEASPSCPWVPAIACCDKRTAIIAVVALIALACLTTGLLSHFQLILGVSAVVRWSLVGGGGAVLFTVIAIQLCRKQEGNAHIEADATWAFQEASTASEVQTEQLVITAFNVGMLPSFVKGLQKVGNYVCRLFSLPETILLDKSVKRIKIIAQQLANAPMKSDILSFQELFCPSATASLCKSLHDYHIVHTVGGGRPVNSGLVFASRYPIKKEEIRFHKFTNLAGEDALSSKGILRVVVTIKDKEVIFYNTHLQAKLGLKYQKIRQEQIESVAELIAADQKQNPTTPIYLCGDFNISDVDIHERTDDYTKLKHVFDKFHDFFLTDHGLDCKRIKNASKHQHVEPTGSFYDIRHESNGQERDQVRYDFILLYKNPGNEHLTSADTHSEFQRWAHGAEYACQPPFLSDHCPLTVHIPME